MKKCWVLTEGMIGTQNQCVALAQAAGLEPEIKVVKLKQPWKTVTPWISHFSPAALATGSSELAAPWPDIVIASGRKAIAPALWIKKQSGNKTKLVIVQSPVIKNRNFDLVIVPRHDLYDAPNALAITGALSLITPPVLLDAKEEWRDILGTLKSPRIGVLIGGNSRTHKMTESVTKMLAMQLQNLLPHYSLMITASRRTPQAYQDYLRRQVTGENVFFWDGDGNNPYRGILAWADALIVTEDSVSMASEAISTGKPVYILKMTGGSARFARFHNHLIQNNYAQWFKGVLDPWGYIPPDDLANATKAVTNLLT